MASRLLRHSMAGRVAVVTGGAGAIGKATAQALLEEGCTVVLAGRRLEALERVSEEIGSSGGNIRCLRLDVTEEEQVVDFFDSVVNNAGGLDILINNAGVALGGDPCRISAE